MSRSIVFGDIHGCSEALSSVLGDLDIQSDDTVIFLGDYVDRGSDSAAVIDTLIGLRERCTVHTLLGNHEIMMLTAIKEKSERAFWESCGGKQTLASYGGSYDEIPPAHIEFLEECKLYHEEADYFYVHANYAADKPLDKQPEYILLWEHLTAHMPAAHVSGKTAIVGHTPQRDGEVLVVDHLICIDTYCYGGGWLTALDLSTQTLCQADMEGRLRD